MCRSNILSYYGCFMGKSAVRKTLGQPPFIIYTLYESNKCGETLSKHGTTLPQYSCSVLPLRLPSCEVNEWVGLWSCCSFYGESQAGAQRRTTGKCHHRKVIVTLSVSITAIWWVCLFSDPLGADKGKRIQLRSHHYVSPNSNGQ